MIGNYSIIFYLHQTVVTDYRPFQLIAEGLA